MHQFVMAENVATNSHNDDTNWQAVGCQVDQQYVLFMSSVTDSDIKIPESKFYSNKTLERLNSSTILCY